MNSRSKPTGPRKTGVRSRKPATIDLEAKDVGAKAEDSADTVKKEGVESSATSSKSDNSSQRLGREGAKKSTENAQSKPNNAEAKKGSAETTDSQPTPAPARKSGGGFFSGLMGAAAAVLGLGAIGQYDGAKDIPFLGALYSGGAEQVANVDVSGEIAGLSQQIEALKSTSAAVDLTPVNDRLAEIEAAVAGGDASAATANRLSEVETALAGVTQTLSSIAKAAEEGGGATSTEVAAAISAVTQRLEKLEGTVGELANAPDAPSESVSLKLSEIETKLNEITSAPVVDLSPIEGKVAGLESSVSSIKESVDALNSQSSTLQETVASVKASEKVARSVAVNALGAALENDDPISLALASIESLGGKTEQTERLTELSQLGIPSRKALLAELNSFTNTVQNPVTDTNTGGISERFWANAKNLVSFRSSGPQEGNSAIAILSRVKANLEAGKLSGAVSEWEKLPAEVRQSGDAWLAKVNTRIEAFALFETLSNTLSAQAG